MRARSLALAVWIGLGAVSCDYHPIDLLPETASVPGSGGVIEPGPSGVGGTTSSGTGGEGGLGGAGETAEPLRVLLVVDDVPISTDEAIESRLLGIPWGRDIEVDRIAEAMTTPETTDGYQLVVVSSSADTAGIGGSLKEVAVPILVLEPGIFDQMGLGPVRRSNSDAEMVVSAPEHPIAHGLTGTITLCGSEVDQVGQLLQPGGVQVGHGVVNTAAGLVVAYERGIDVGGVLPERRVSFGVLKLAACQTETAWEFFDAAVTWLVDDL